MSIAGKTAKVIFEPLTHPYQSFKNIAKTQRRIIDLTSDSWTIVQSEMAPPTREIFNEALRPNREKALNLRAFYNVTRFDLERMHSRHYWTFWGCIIGIIAAGFWSAAVAIGGLTMIPVLTMVAIKESYEDYALRHCIIGGFWNWLTSGPAEWVVIATYEEAE